MQQGRPNPGDLAFLCLWGVPTILSLSFWFAYIPYYSINAHLKIVSKAAKH